MRGGGEAGKSGRGEGSKRVGGEEGRTGPGEVLEVLGWADAATALGPTDRDLTSEAAGVNTCTVKRMGLFWSVFGCPSKRIREQIIGVKLNGPQFGAGFWTKKQYLT